MTEPAPTTSLPFPSQVAPLSILSTGAALLLGVGSLALSLAQSSAALFGFGVACLLQVPLSLSLYVRIRAGLGNRGLERELRTLRLVSHGLRVLALGLTAYAAFALVEGQSAEIGLSAVALAALSTVLLAGLWRVKRSMAEVHPSLALDADRARVMLELAAILLAGTLVHRAWPMADALTALALALRLWFAARSMALLSAFKAACGGCGTGCGC